MQIGCPGFLRRTKSASQTRQAAGYGARKLFDFVPSDVAAVEAITGARVRCKLCPQIVALAAFADTLPEIAQPRGEMLVRANRRSGRRCRWRAHQREYRSFFFVALVAWVGIGGVEGAAELHGAEAETIAQMIGGARQLFEFGAAFRGEQIELVGAVRQTA